MHEKHRDFFYFMMSEHDIFVVKAGLFSCLNVAFFTTKKNSQKQKLTDFLKTGLFTGFTFLYFFPSKRPIKNKTTNYAFSHKSNT